jgi:hypothetical protein
LPPAVDDRGEVVEKLQGGEARPQASVVRSEGVGGLLTTCAVAPWEGIADGGGAAAFRSGETPAGGSIKHTTRRLTQKP